MKEILRSGVTGILVSHSISQIKELCNKVLWLDHGCQIIYSDQTQLVCDAYEEYLDSKRLPKNKKDILTLAEKFNQKQLVSHDTDDIKQLELLFEKCDRKVAINVAKQFIKKADMRN